MNEKLSRKEIVELGKLAKVEEHKKVIELKNRGYSNVAIGQELGLNESSVRMQLKISDLARRLREEVDVKGSLDVGKGAEKHLDVSMPKLIAALHVLKNEGYEILYISFSQVGTDKKTVVKVLATPGTTYKDILVNKKRPSRAGDADG